MEGSWAPLASAFRQAIAHWASISAASTFVLYLFGYLSLRFKLTALGVGTDLSFLDERYLFEGIRFLVYIVSIIPNLLLVGLVLAAPGWLALRLTPQAWRERAAGATPVRRVWLWGSHPSQSAMIGIVVSLVVIQIFLRKVLPISNLLVADRITTEGWLACLLVNGSGGRTYLYFHALVAAAVLTCTLLLVATTSAVERPRLRPARGTLAFLLVVQILLLPINHGVLVGAAQAMPRVRTIGDGSPLPEGTTAWLVWEGRDGVTYLIDKRPADANGRALVTLPREKVSIVEIVGYDSPVRDLFSPAVGCRSSGPGQAGRMEAAR